METPQGLPPCVACSIQLWRPALCEGGGGSELGRATLRASPFLQPGIMVSYVLGEGGLADPPSVQASVGAGLAPMQL